MKQRAMNRMLPQTAVYWGAPVNDGYGGYTFVAPVECKCRWIEKQEKFIKNAEEIVSDAVVLLEIPVEVKGMLWLGSLVDLNSAMTPQAESGAYEIKHFQRRICLKDSTFVNKALL